MRHRRWASFHPSTSSHSQRRGSAVAPPLTPAPPRSRPPVNRAAARASEELNIEKGEANTLYTLSHAVATTSLEHGLGAGLSAIAECAGQSLVDLAIDFVPEVRTGVSAYHAVEACRREPDGQ
jgi:hypothetical protein